MDRDDKSQTAAARLKDNWPEWLAAAIAAAVYIFLFDRYLLNDIDDTWTTSWVYYFIHDGQMRDMIFMEQVPEYWGVRFFSHVFCLVYGSVLKLLGFTRANVHLISNFFMLCGFFLWYKIGHRLWKNRKTAVCLVLMLAFSTLCLSAANKGRSDAFIFFLQSAALMLFIGKFYFSSVLVLCLAVETHPIGILGGCYLAAYAVIYDKDLFLLKNRKGLIRLAAGGLAGIGIYLLLHHAELRNLPAMFKMSETPANFLYMHFFGRGHFPWRYWPDLFIFALAAVWAVCRWKREKQCSFPLAATFFLLAGSLLIRRGNFHYALFCYPAFLMLAADVFGQFRWKKIPLLLVCWAGIQLPQFAYLYHKNASCRDYRFYLDVLSRTDFPANAVIYGHPADWFGLQKYRGFRSLTHFHMPKCKFYLIEHDGTCYQQPDIKPVPKEKLQLKKLKSVRLPSGGSIEISEADPVQ